MVHFVHELLIIDIARVTKTCCVEQACQAHTEITKSLERLCMEWHPLDPSHFSLLCSFSKG